jgi:hypothetical protein
LKYNLTVLVVLGTGKTVTAANRQLGRSCRTGQYFFFIGVPGIGKILIDVENLFFFL